MGGDELCSLLFKSSNNFSMMSGPVKVGRVTACRTLSLGLMGELGSL